MKKFFVYVIKNNQGERYIGSTENLVKRLETHNDTSREKAKFHRYTYKKGPWRLIFKKEFNTRKEALLFEKYLKTGKGRRWLNGRTRHGG
jgi:putative endonuclease